MTANPTLLAMPLAQNGQKNVIPETQATPGNGLFSQSEGFPAETSLPLGAGGTAPSREDFNGIANLLGGVAFYAQKGWQFQFDAAQDYYEGCIVRDTTDGKLYECINDVVAGGSVPSADSTNWKAFSTGGVQVGFIAPYAGTGLAEGWLECDGSAVSRTMYADLFSAIGTTFGPGDGSTTFNLPNEQFLKGIGYGTGNAVPVIYGSAYTYTTGFPYANDNFSGKQIGVYRDSSSIGMQTCDVQPFESHDGITNVAAYDVGKLYPLYADLSSATPQYSSNIRYMIKYE